jgi:hypothetical protein
LPEAAEIGGLAGVLEVIREDAHHAHAYGGQWLVLGLVQLALEIRWREPAYKGFGSR